MTRVGIDLRIVRFSRTGFRRYAAGLVRALERHTPANTQVMLLLHEQDQPMTAAPHLHQVRLRTELFGPDEAQGLRTELTPLHLDVVHFPFSLFPGRVAPRVTLTVHDVTCRVRPETIEPAYLPSYANALRDANQADQVMAVSQATARALTHEGVDGSRVAVCYPLTPFEPGYPTHQAGPPELAILGLVAKAPYVLAVGTLEPRKNHNLLLDAFTTLRRSGAPYARLVIAGALGWLMDGLHAQLNDHPFRDDIHVVLDATDGTVRVLMQHCAVFVNASHHEGFSLPPLEALEAGACVLSTPVPSLVEAGVPSHALIDADNPEALADRLARLLADAPARLALAADSQAVVGGFYRSLNPARLAQAYSA